VSEIWERVKLPKFTTQTLSVKRGTYSIGVDPFYLAQKAQEVGYHPEIILAGRRMNDSMGKYVATRVIKLMMKKGIQVRSSKVLLLGFTFKENCPDIRNTRVIDIYQELCDFDVQVDVYDPWINKEDVKHEYNIEILPVTEPPVLDGYNAVILAVAHKDFEEMKLVKKKDLVLFDVKGVLPLDQVDERL